ncbi:UDP-N-acetyl-D-glucosamine 2-epimerase, UDP-hydrolysing [Desulfamplus magnetovallimortis]|uniref:UDP-N-acetyl-D-glucosamine 2-epimerase, UDP-hydrolysing n=1 Tax=Desulfamplus magnetovallimortis TaxID=1246637 RepID=A0A1W1HEQ7_9BACT|nr:UDP-N-acetylglucosamine 2-epimerase [Desulfamplus magnetovallimortis]SLM30977.1 UDP-N-acetyl-D-glucosamine 2-epimerase, UDP-hydrolysing [Desulfamplus magnetovallimortis]
METEKINRKIAVFTGTRAEYGLLRPLLSRLKASETVNLKLIVSGMHLAPEFGLTFKEIEKDGFFINEKVEILLSSDKPGGTCKSMGLGMIGLSDALERIAPDMVIILGDRFEAFSMGAAAMIHSIPIAHIHGGETTLGAIDDSMRHCLTKMASLHFTTTETHRKRVIQMGEEADLVFNVGALGIENIGTMELMSKEVLGHDIGFNLSQPYILVTFHPVTLNHGSADSNLTSLCSAIEYSGLCALFTKSNADSEGRIINEIIDRFVQSNPKRYCVVHSLGTVRYLSAMYHCEAVVGNSSSGIIEAPSLGIPTVDIGNRQKGRVRAESIISCSPEQKTIEKAIEKAVSNEFRAMAKKIAKNMLNPYEGPSPSKDIFDIISTISTLNLFQKKFYDFNLPDDLQTIHPKYDFTD